VKRAIRAIGDDGENGVFKTENTENNRAAPPLSSFVLRVRPLKIRFLRARRLSIAVSPTVFQLPEPIEVRRALTA
jgi:hypothetical protein